MRSGNPAPLQFASRRVRLHRGGPPRYRACKSKAERGYRPALQELYAKMRRQLVAKHLLQCRVNEWPATTREQAGQQRQHVSLRGEQSAGTRLARDRGQKRARPRQTPTYSSWLNQVENWFSRIQHDVIARGVFTTVKDLDKKLMRYIRQYNKCPKPIKWKYNNPNKRIRCDLIGSLD